MPAVAVIGGALAAGTAAASIAAGSLMMASGLALAGGLATMVGGVTGNKKLMTIGAIATLGAGVAGGFEGLFGAGEAATAASAGAEIGQVTGATEALSATNLPSLDALSAPAELANVGVGSASSAAGSLPAADIFSTAEGVGASGGSLLSNAPPITPTEVGATQTFSTQTPATSIPSATKLAVNSGGASIPTTQISDSVVGAGLRAPASIMSTPALESMGQAAAKLGAPETGAAMFGNFGKFLNENKGLVTLGTGILGGIGQGAMAQEQYKMQQAMDQQRRRELNNAVASIQSRRV